MIDSATGIRLIRLFKRGTHLKGVNGFTRDGQPTTLSGFVVMSARVYDERTHKPTDRFLITLADSFDTAVIGHESETAVYLDQAGMVATHVANRGDLNSIMEIDHVITVHDDGTITEPSDVYAPELYDGVVGTGWTLMDGYSGQYLYSGPIMHASEYIGGRLADDILSMPGTYVALVDIDLSDDTDDNINGWAVARKN
jgi:hypothetical protein